MKQSLGYLGYRGNLEIDCWFPTLAPLGPYLKQTPEILPPREMESKAEEPWLLTNAREGRQHAGMLSVRGGGAGDSRVSHYTNVITA